MLTRVQQKRILITKLSHRLAQLAKAEKASKKEKSYLRKTFKLPNVPASCAGAVIRSGTEHYFTINQPRPGYRGVRRIIKRVQEPRSIQRYLLKDLEMAGNSFSK